MKNLSPAKILISIYILIIISAFIVIYFADNIRQSASLVPQPPVIMECLDDSLTPYADMWRAEIGRRFDNALGILVHGGDEVQGQWVISASLVPDHYIYATTIVDYFQKLYPDRTIVLCACNTGHLKLGRPGVYYAKSEVWCIPDHSLTTDNFGEQSHAKLGPFDDPFPFPNIIPSATTRPILPTSRWIHDPDVVGSIFEFVTDE